MLTYSLPQSAPGLHLNQARLDALLNDIRLLGWVDMDDPPRGTGQAPAIHAAAANWVRCMCEFIHESALLCH